MEATTNSNPIQTALSALKSGQDVEQAVYGVSTETPPPSTSTEDAERAEASEAIQEPEASEESEANEASEESEAPEADRAIEEVILDAKSGKKVKVDFSDKEKMKRYVQLAHANFKWKADKDKAETRLKEIEPQFQDLSKTWSALEAAWEANQAAGVINLLAGDENAYSRLIAEQEAKFKRKMEATPAELKQIEYEERLAEAKKREEAIQKKLDSILGDAEAKKQQAVEQSLQTNLTSGFSKYRFAGKLGDEVIEHQFDEALWETTKANLNKLPEEVELTAQVIEAEFKKVASTFNKVITKQAQATAKKVLTKKKVEAQENLSAKALNNYSTNENTNKFMKDINSGNLSGAFKSFISGKVRL